MKALWKVEAQHSTGDGAVMQFFPSYDMAEREQVRLRRCGWFVDCERIAERELTDASILMLIEGYWPVMPLGAVLELAKLSRLSPFERAIPLDTTYELVSKE